MEPQRSILAIVSIWIYWIRETQCCVIQSYPWHHPWPRSPQQWWCIERCGMWPWSTPGGRGEIQEILGNSDLVNISYRWLHMVWTFYHWLHLPGIKHPSKILLASLFLLITEKRAFLRVLILFPHFCSLPDRCHVWSANRSSHWQNPTKSCDSNEEKPLLGECSFVTFGPGGPHILLSLHIFRGNQPQSQLFTILDARLLQSLEEGCQCIVYPSICSDSQFGHCQCHSCPADPCGLLSWLLTPF